MGGKSGSAVDSALLKFGEKSVLTRSWRSNFVPQYLENDGQRPKFVLDATKMRDFKETALRRYNQVFEAKRSN